MKQFLLLMSAVLAGFSSAQGQAPQGVQAAQSVPAKVRVLRSLRYAPRPVLFESDSSSDRLLDLYLPTGVPQGRIPVLVFIHGGGFSGGDKTQVEPLCSALSAQGFAVVSINYRLELKRVKTSGAGAGANMAKGLPVSGKFHPALQAAILSAAQDTQLALGWIKEQAPQYQFDTARVALAGGSAGAMTALYTAYVSGQRVLAIKAIVNLWGGLEDAGLIRPHAPPVLTYHGDQDETISIAYAHALHKRLEKNGDQQSELHIMPGKGHARYDIVMKEKPVEIAAFLRKNLSSKK